MAATFIFKLGTLDLSSFCRMNPDDRFDPYSAHFLEPAFAETPFADTQSLISTTVQNREMSIPLFLRDASLTKDALHALVRSVNNQLAQRPLSVEWRDDSASASTFFDVVFGRFEPDFNFRRSQRGYGAGVLHLYVAGYGHTGTTRVCATAAGTGVFLSVPVGSVAGDAPGLLQSVITDGGVVPSLGRIVAVAPITQPSYTPQIPAASLTDLQAGATVVGASGADGSQYLALPVSPTGGASGVACMVPLPNPTIAGGDNRILAVVRSGIDAGVGMYAVDPFGNSMGATAVASTSQGFSLVDLGVCRLPTVGYPTLPKISIYAGAILASGAAGPLILSSPAGLALNEVLCLPDKNLALIYERGAAALSRDGFTGNGLLDGQNDSLGNPWSDSFNFNNASLGLTEHADFVNLNLAAPQTTDGAHLGGILTDSMLITTGALTYGGEVKLLKEMATGVYLTAWLSAASSFLALAAATNTTLNLLASVAVLADAGNLVFSLRVQGGAALANLRPQSPRGLTVAGASSAFASISASSAAVSRSGMPGVALVQASAGWAGPMVFSWEVDTLASSNILPYDSYTIDGVNADSWRTSSAGVFAGQKLVEKQRGAFPKLVPSTTSVAIVAAAVDQGPANDLISAVISVRERFTYAR